MANINRTGNISKVELGAVLDETGLQNDQLGETEADKQEGLDSIAKATDHLPEALPALLSETVDEIADVGRDVERISMDEEQVANDESDAFITDTASNEEAVGDRAEVARDARLSSSVEQSYATAKDQINEAIQDSERSLAEATDEFGREIEEREKENEGFRGDVEKGRTTVRGNLSAK